jgi:predicted Zn-dependent protease
MPRECPTNKLEAVLAQTVIDPQGALEEFERLYKRYPMDPYLRYNYGIALAQQGYHPQALPHLEFAAPRMEGPEGYEGLVRLYAELEMPMHALRVARNIHTAEGKKLARSLEPTLPVPPDMSEKDHLEFEEIRFAIMYRQSEEGLERVRAFLRRFPDYRPALNLAAGASADAGDFDQALQYAQRALQLSPRNPHSLYVLARLSLLTEGLEATRAFIAEHMPARTRKDPVPDEPLARAQTWALVDDDVQVERALKAWDRSLLRRLAHPVAGWLQERLEERSAQPEGQRRPYFDLTRLLSVQAFRRWNKGAQREVFRRVAADLKRMPGLLELLPQRLGFEDEWIVTLIASTLLEEQPPVPAGPWSDWTEVFKQIVREGPGEVRSRLVLAALLSERGLAGAEELQPQEAEGPQLLQLEIRFDPEPSPLRGKEDEQFIRALKHMRKQRYKQARELLQPLAVRYPDYTSLQFNLAICELADKSSGDPLGGQARLERIAHEHPTYLFAKAQLAVQALQAGNLERAREWLVYPQGLKSVHAQEYAVFLAAQGMLAAREGDIEQAERCLEAIEQLGQEDIGFYRALERELEVARMFGRFFRKFRGTGKRK